MVCQTAFMAGAEATLCARANSVFWKKPCRGFG
jgi:hypothetical protein